MATYTTNRSAANVTVRPSLNGHALVGSGTQDLGTGMYTVMQQTAAEALGLDLIDVKLGDSSLPKAPVSGGSQSTASARHSLLNVTVLDIPIPSSTHKAPVASARSELPAR